jgi:hypothetical protein
MNSDLEKKLAQVAEETFASMAFVLPPEEEESVEDDGSSQSSASITFSGPFSGGLFLSVSQCMLPILADNILGIEESCSTSPEEQQDALKEMLNVICGNLLPLIATPKDVFHVHQPRFVPDSEVAETFVSGVLEARVNLRLDCGRVELSLSLDRPADIVEV